MLENACMKDEPPQAHVGSISSIAASAMDSLSVVEEVHDES
jgi:hypothetical protein